MCRQLYQEGILKIDDPLIPQNRIIYLAVQLVLGRRNLSLTISEQKLPFPFLKGRSSEMMLIPMVDRELNGVIISLLMHVRGSLRNEKKKKKPLF